MQMTADINKPTRTYTISMKSFIDRNADLRRLEALKVLNAKIGKPLSDSSYKRQMDCIDKVNKLKSDSFILQTTNAKVLALLKIIDINEYNKVTQ